MRAACLLAFLLTACARESPPRAPTEASAASAPAAPARHEPAPAWPASLRVGERDAPTLYRGSRAGATGYAWIAPGETLSPRGAVRRGRVRAVVDGPLRLRGWTPVAGLEGVVTRRGRVAGTPLFVVPGDVVRLVGVEGELAVVRGAARFAHPARPRSDELVGRIPLTHLGAATSGGGPAGTPGRPILIHARTPLLDRPGGDAAWEIPALDPPLTATVLREADGWLGVRLGMGPHLVGWIRAPGSARKKDAGTDPEVLDPWDRDRRGHAQPAVQDPWAPREEAEPEAPDPDLPPRLRDAVVRPVWQVAPGTRVEVEGATVAVFTAPGHGVELDRDGDRVEILGAVDDTATVRGWVPAAALSPR